MAVEADASNKKKITGTLILTVFLTCFGSSMLYGYNMAVINLPAERIKCFLNRTVLLVPCTQDYLQNNNTAYSDIFSSKWQANENAITTPSDQSLRNPIPWTFEKIYNEHEVMKRFKRGVTQGSTNVPSKGDINNFQSTRSSPAEKSRIDADFLYAQTNSIFVIAGIIGAFSTGWIADNIGRRNGLLVNHVFVIIGGLINAFTVYANRAALLFVGRFMIGINAGVTIGLASMYLTEIAPREYRGAIGACHQLAVTIGIVIGYIITMSHTLNTDTLWPVACGCTAIPAIISLVLLPLCPESPRFIFLKRAKESLSRKEFLRINQSEDVDVFLGELREEVEIAKNQPKFRFLQLFTQRDLRMPLVIACLIQIMQQLSGINAVIAYSSSMLSTAGIPDRYSQYCVIAIGLLNVISTLISLPLIEKFGRRTLLLWPSVVLAASLLIMTITVNLVNAPDILSLEIKKLVGGISTAFIMIYIIGFALGLGPIPGLIVSEIFRQEPRGAAYSVSQAIQWTANLMVLFIYPTMNKSIGGYSFLPFLVVVVVCWVFFFLFMPETRNRIVDDVARDLSFGICVIGKKSQPLRQPLEYKNVSTEDHNDEVEPENINMDDIRH